MDIHYEISPLDGRYGKRLEALGAYFSEFALMRARCEIELRYVLALNETGLFSALSDGLCGEIIFCLAKQPQEDEDKKMRHLAHPLPEVESCGGQEQVEVVRVGWTGWRRS